MLIWQYTVVMNYFCNHVNFIIAIFWLYIASCWLAKTNLWLARFYENSSSMKVHASI